MFAKQLKDMRHQQMCSEAALGGGPALAAGTGVMGNVVWLIPLPPT